MFEKLGLPLLPLPSSEKEHALVQGERDMWNRHRPKVQTEASSQYVIRPLAKRQIHEEQEQWLLFEATGRHEVMCFITDCNAPNVSVIY